MLRCLFPLDRILRYVSVATIACGGIAIIGCRPLCARCMEEGYCLGCVVVKVASEGEEWKFGV